MSLLSQVFGTKLQASVTHEPWSEFWYSSVGSFTHTGIPVSAETSLSVSAVYCAVRILSETVAQVPLIIYRRRSDGGKERAPNHPLFDLLHDQPNVWQTSFEWREMMMGHILLRGNSYAEIVPGPRGAVDQLIPLHPDRVKVKQLQSGRLVYEYTPRMGDTRTLNQDDVFHVRGLSSDGITGVSPVTLMRQSVGLSLATEKYGAELFNSDGAMRVVIKHPGRLDPDARTSIRKSISDGIKQNKGTALLEEGMSIEKIGMTAEDAQFLTTRQFEIAEFARWFNIPPHLLRDLTKSSFSNIQEQSLEFVQYSMMPWFKRWEQAITRDLILAPQTFFAEFLVDGLLRGDQKSRHEAYGSAIQNGWMTRNEVRIKESMNPLPGLDMALQPLNMAPAAAHAERLEQFTRSAVANVVRKEINTLRTAYDKAFGAYGGGGVQFWSEAERFYAKHLPFVTAALKIDSTTSDNFIEAHKTELHETLQAEERGEVKSVVGLLNRWEFTAEDELTSLVLAHLEGQQPEPPAPRVVTEPMARGAEQAPPAVAIEEKPTIVIVKG